LQGIAIILTIPCNFRQHILPVSPLESGYIELFRADDLLALTALAKVLSHTTTLMLQFNLAAVETGRFWPNPAESCKIASGTDEKITDCHDCHPAFFLRTGRLGSAGSVRP
jgi:hypothetical protein